MDDSPANDKYAIGAPQELPPGHQNLGPLNKIDPSLLQSDHSDAPPLDWEQVEIAPGKNGARFKYRPVMDIPLIAHFEGGWRPSPHFYENEREMFVMAFANAISEYLFGRDMFIEKPTALGVKFKPNPKFKKLPCIKFNKSVETAKIVDQAVDRAQGEVQSLLPVVFSDGDKPLGSVKVTATQANIAWVERGLPAHLELTRFDANEDALEVTRYVVDPSEDITQD